MAELTTEQKAKRYDDASKWLEGIYPTLTHEQQMEAEAFFPELKESEDEVSWKDMREIYIIFAEVDAEIELCKTDIKAETIGYYQEVLKRFKNLKNTKENTTPAKE